MSVLMEGDRVEDPGGNLFAGRYLVQYRLGYGGASVVHRALDVRLGRPVALKVYHPHPSIDAHRGRRAEHAARFAVEARVLAGMSHPGLVGVYDFGDEDGRPYLVLELVPGHTLRDRVEAGPLDPETVLRLGLTLAQTIGYVHRHGVVHRDIKPSNIVFDAAGGPRLVDFGAALPSDAAALTCTGEVIGTAAYLAPEQVLGRRAGPAADVHALGLVLIECLTGVREYPGPPVEAALARLDHRPGIPPGLPGSLGSILAWMTEPDPEDRPPAAWCARLLGVEAEALDIGGSRFLAGAGTGLRLRAARLGALGGNGTR